MPTLKRVSNTTGDNRGVDAVAAKTSKVCQQDAKEERYSDEKYSQYWNKTTQRSQHEPLSLASAISNSNYQSVDIVAVVLSIQQPQNVASKASKGNAARVRVLVGDNSLPSGQCVRINISHSLQNSGLELQPGDVVRFNGMVVRNININDVQDTVYSPKPKKQKLQIEDTGHAGSGSSKLKAASQSGTGLLKVLCDLYLSWNEQTTGPPMVRLYRTDQCSTHNLNAAEEFSFNCYNVASSHVETSLELVQQLVKWYCSTKSPSSMQSTSKVCQRRRLREITTPNLTSHVVVKVLRCEKASQKWSNKRPSEPCITHATISDGSESEDIMGIGGSVQIKQMSGDSSFIPKPIATVLLQSLTEGCYIMLSHVMSKNTNTTLGSESLMLVPTQETIATVITPDHPFYIKHSPLKENAFASQPITLERATQLYSMSQHLSPSVANEVSGGCRGMMAVVSPLRDILVDGIFASFREGRYWQNNQSLSKFLIDTPSISTPFKSIKLRPTYRSATIVLDPSVFAKEMVVNADSDALKLLCMDVLAESMVMDWDDGKKHPYLSHVGALLKGLCEEKTPIRWVLEQESESSWFVSSASLIEI